MKLPTCCLFMCLNAANKSSYKYLQALPIQLLSLHNEQCTKAGIWTCSFTHAVVDHVRSLCSCCLDCLEDVHCSFNFDSLNFRHTSDEHTTAGHTVTESDRIRRELHK